MKRWLLEFIQIAAASIFAGIAIYGAILYWGGETRKKIPVSSSLLLGLGAVVCLIVIVATGQFLDKIALMSEKDDGPGGGKNG